MATNEKLAEPIVKALMAIVLANMPAALAKVAASYATDDPVPLPEINAANYYFGERQIIPEYPALVFDFDSTGIDPEQSGNTWGSYDWTLMVDVLVESDDETVLAKQIARYSRALWEIFYSHQNDVSADGAAQATSVIPRNGMRSPLVPREGAFFKGWRWLLEAHRIDDIT